MNDVTKDKPNTVQTIVGAGIALIGIGVFLICVAILLTMIARS